MSATALHERMLAAAGNRTYRHVGELTSTHPETVRRYLQGQSPSAEFLSAMCASLGVSGDWMLTGRGPMKLEDQRAHVLRQADAADLMSAMADTLERLIDRVERLESFIQTLETRLRARQSAPFGHASETGPHATDHTVRDHTGRPNPIAPLAAVPVPQRVERIEDVLAQRPRPDAR